LPVFRGLLVYLDNFPKLKFTKNQSNFVTKPSSGRTLGGKKIFFAIPVNLDFTGFLKTKIFHLPIDLRARDTSHFFCGVTLNLKKRPTNNFKVVCRAFFISSGFRFGVKRKMPID